MNEHYGGISCQILASSVRDGLDRLLAAAARGEHGAFDLVYERLSGPVYGVIRTVIRDPGQAEEVAQEVLLEIWRTSVRYDPGKGSAAAWALTIARRRPIAPSTAAKWSQVSCRRR